MVAHISAFLKELKPHATVTLTPTLPVPGAPHSMADIKCVDGPRTYLIDVTCSNPMSVPSIEGRRSTIYYPDAASDTSQNLKQAQYTRNLAQRPDIQANSVAIVVDTHGRLGTNGRAFFATIGAHEPGLVAGLRKQLAQTALVYAGRMLAEIMHCRQNNIEYGIRRANPEIPAPPRGEEYNRWDEAQRTRRGRRPPQAQAPQPPNPNPIQLMQPPPPLQPDPPPRSPLGRDDPILQRPRRGQVRPATPQSTPPREEDEVQEMQGRSPIEEDSSTGEEDRGPTATQTPPTPAAPEGPTGPPQIDIDALMANPHGPPRFIDHPPARPSTPTRGGRGRQR